MNDRKQQAIVRDRKHGYKIWKIAKMHHVSENDVLFVLVEHGLIPESFIEAIAKDHRRKECRDAAY